MDDRARSPLRYLAPVALIAATVVFIAVIAASSGGRGESPAAQSAAQTEAAPDRGESRRGPAETYEVQEGDTLDAISRETGVSVEELQELNPDLDPQTLVSGQRIKLRE